MDWEECFTEAQLRSYYRAHESSLERLAKAYPVEHRGLVHAIYTQVQKSHESLEPRVIQYLHLFVEQETIDTIYLEHGLKPERPYRVHVRDNDSTD